MVMVTMMRKITPKPNKLNAITYPIYKNMLDNLSKRVILDQLIYSFGSMGSDSERNNSLKPQFTTVRNC
jgi:hypothetical protein